MDCLFAQWTGRKGESLEVFYIHWVTYQCNIWHFLLLDKGFNVCGHRFVGMYWIVRTVSMISEILKNKKRCKMQVTIQKSRSPDLYRSLYILVPRQVDPTLLLAFYRKLMNCVSPSISKMALLFRRLPVLTDTSIILFRSEETMHNKYWCTTIIWGRFGGRIINLMN